MGWRKRKSEQIHGSRAQHWEHWEYWEDTGGHETLGTLRATLGAAAADVVRNIEL